MMSRLSEQDHTDAQRMQSRRVLLAFRRGSDHRSPEDEAHPGRALLAGLVLAALATLVAGVVGLVRGGPPEGWDNEGNVVIDDKSGSVYIVESGALRPVVNETSLRLAFPDGPPEPVRVDAEAIASRPSGAALGRADLPATPPRLAGPDSRVIACVDGGQTAVIAGAAGPAGDQAVAVVRAGKQLFLAAGGRAYPLADLTTVSRLGYPVNGVRSVPPQLLTTLQRGAPIASIALPRARPLPRGTPPWMRTGTRVKDAGSERWYLAVNGVLRPVANETTWRLVFGTRQPPGRAVPPAALRTQRVGPPLVGGGLPDRPPKLTKAEVLCADQALRTVPELPVSGLVRTPVTAGSGADSGKAALWTPRDAGLLVAASEKAAAAPSAKEPVLLLAQGRAFPVESAEVLRALGYSGQPATVLPREWLDGLPLAEPITQPN